ncbi:MAG: polysaccharide biosynthesis tyrosine autokinase [Herminiimonas sp.]|nr:polysaccharide biosynthesis tyrosine autokinase [Herminiimonas sp.]MDB5852770.1 polysaccharide biosynthesis tyrosine autokinase [Herminiimonas sp.]
MNQIIQHPGPAYLQPQAVPTILTDDSEVELSSYLNVLYDNRWMIAMIALAVALMGAAFAYLVKPVYEANMVVHVEEDAPKETKNILGEMGAMFNVKTATSAEMELIKSRLVVSRAIDNLRLYIEARPKYFPVVGKFLASHNKQLSTPGVFGYGGFNWGDEKVDVSAFNVPDALIGKEFTLTAEGNGQYRVDERDGSVSFRGQVGTPLSVATPKGQVELTVDQLNAHAGAQFFLRRSSRLAAIENVQTSLVVAEQGKQSGIVSATLQGEDPQEVSKIMTAISTEYIRQNSGRKTEEADKTLATLNKQLPDLKVQLEQSEAKYNAFRNAHGSIDLGEEAKINLQQSAAAKAKRIELEQRKTELLTRFTVNHPVVMGVDAQLRDINTEMRKSAEAIKALPAVEQEAVRLQREVKVNTDLYTALLNTAQQLRLITISKMSNVRLVDAPMTPDKPISPNRPKIIAIALMLGLFLGVVAAFMKKALHGGIDDPAEIEKMLGVPVYATIPHSKMQKELFDQVSRKSPKLPLLAKISSMDVAVEALRNFRTALQFSMSHSKNNIVLMTGPTAGMGKSFVSANLAAVMASSGKRVLLIDADFRNGHLHRYFDLGRQDGLADAIAGNKRLEQIVHREVIDNVDFISTGTLPSNPSELLMRPNLGTLLESLSALYDVVLIDGTPILAVSDTLIIGEHAGAIYILTRAGVTTPGEIAESIKRLSQAGLSAKGVLFNDLAVRPGRYGYGYKYGKYRQVQYSYGSQPLIEASPSVR